MRRTRPGMQNQLQAKLAGVLKQAGHSFSRDGVELRPGRFFHVKDSRERLEYGFDRQGDPGRDRPALLLKRWRDDFWFVSPASLLEPLLQNEKFKVEHDDWAFWNESGNARDQFLNYWYERLLTDFLYNHKADLRPERLKELKAWLQRHHSGSKFRSADLEGDWGTLQ